MGGGGAIHTANGKDISNKNPCGTARGGGSGVAGARVENAAPPVLVRPAAPIWWSGVRPRDRASISVTLSGTGHIPVRVAWVYRGGVTGGRGGGGGALAPSTFHRGGGLSPTTFSEASRVKSIVSIKREDRFILRIISGAELAHITHLSPLHRMAIFVPPVCDHKICQVVVGGSKEAEWLPRSFKGGTQEVQTSPWTPWSP